MRRNQQYAAYRPPLTEEQKSRVSRAENPVKEYGRIAVEEAKKQLSVAVNADGAYNALPEGEDVCLRIPGIDPRGQYSILSMKVSRRSRVIESTLPLREKAVGELVGEILSAPAVRERWIGLQKLSQRHRILTRAEKLCWDERAADSLHMQARRLEVDPVVAEVDLVLQGVEYLLGIREGRAPAEVDRFYRDVLGVEFSPEQRAAARRLVQPLEAELFFPDFENVLLQALFSMPENWGLSISELEALRDEEDEE